MKRLAILVALLSGCSGADSTASKDSPKDTPKQASGDAQVTPTPEAGEPDTKADAQPDTKADASAEEKTEEKTEPAEPVAEPEPPAIPEAAPGEVAIKPWSSSPKTPTWRLVAEPSEALTLTESLNAGVLAHAGSSWLQRGADGQLVAAEWDRDPVLPILGVWPSDAWHVESRDVEEGDFTYVELRLMKLRGGNRWVPQVYDGGGGEQWFHPGTDDEVAPHMSTISGMLVYADSLEEISRVAGNTAAPEIGEHRGDVVDFLETGAHKVYVISVDDGAYYVQTQCEDPECVASNAMKLPLTGWSFGDRIARGRHSVSVLARSGDRDFLLHHRGKSDGWLLEELPAGQRPDHIWASEEGGLWTRAGDHLRWRDTESAWYDVALPTGMTGPTLALTEDRKEVWIAGQVGGATKIYATSANAEVTPTP